MDYKNHHEVYVYRYFYWTCPKCETEHQERIEFGAKVDCWWRECEKCGDTSLLYHKRPKEQTYYNR